MKRFLTTVLASLKKHRKPGKTVTRRRQVRLQIECLEDRFLPSGNSMAVSSLGEFIPLISGDQGTPAVVNSPVVNDPQALPPAASTVPPDGISLTQAATELATWDPITPVDSGSSQGSTAPTPVSDTAMAPVDCGPSQATATPAPVSNTTLAPVDSGPIQGTDVPAPILPGDGTGSVVVSGLPQGANTPAPANDTTAQTDPTSLTTDSAQTQPAQKATLDDRLNQLLHDVSDPQLRDRLTNLANQAQATGIIDVKELENIKQAQEKQVTDKYWELARVGNKDTDVKIEWSATAMRLIDDYHDKIFAGNGTVKSADALNQLISDLKKLQRGEQINQQETTNEIDQAYENGMTALKTMRTAGQFAAAGIASAVTLPGAAINAGYGALVAKSDGGDGKDMVQGAVTNAGVAVVGEKVVVPIVKQVWQSTVQATSSVIQNIASWAGYDPAAVGEVLNRPVGQVFGSGNGTPAADPPAAPQSPAAEPAPSASDPAAATPAEAPENIPVPQSNPAPDPVLTEAAGPLQEPWMIRPGEGTPPASARVAQPGSPMELDPNVSDTYMYTVMEDGSIRYAPQETVTGPDGVPQETVKHTDLAEGGPARVSGEIKYNPDSGNWEMDANSGRYSFHPEAGNTRTLENLEAAAELARQSGTAQNIIANPAVY